MNRACVRSAAACLVALVSGCNATVPAGAVPPHVAPVLVGPDAIRTPALVVVTPNGILKYYPVTQHGGRRPIEIAKIPQVRVASSMAADGRTLAIADEGKPGVVLYDLSTKATQVLSDPYGVPIDVAVDRSANVYVLNKAGSAASTVVSYPAHSRQAAELSCKALVRGVAIAADNEGDLFINGYGTKTAGVVEFPSGPNGPRSGNCRRLELQPERGYVAGVAVDPKTDDLVVVNDPQTCSGGIEGQMTIYPKPYDERTAHSIDLNGRCVGLVRLNASSSLIFALDRTSAFAHAYVIGRSYPQGTGDATYRHKYVGGFTTLPNALPN
jgi:hypothetical protein